MDQFFHQAYSAPMRAVRLQNNPIITPQSHPSLTERGHGNINGPSLIRVPEWVASPLGRYYLYFAHHQGSFIRLAYADSIDGPWQIHVDGALKMSQTPFTMHIASPDLHIDEPKRRFVMVYHGHGGVEPLRDGGQHAAIAFSSDGLNWTHDRVLPVESYLRVFEFDGVRYGISRAGRIYRGSTDGDDWAFDEKHNRIDDSGRHWAVMVRGEALHVFYSRYGDQPEHILHGIVPMRGDWQDWEITERHSLLRPELDWEGASEPVRVSPPGKVLHPVHELRDPAIFEDDGRTYLLYSIAGESGIAIAELV